MGYHRNSGPVNTPSDLVGRTIKDDKGRRYTYENFFRVGGAHAKREVKREGERMKANNEIRNYRVKKYRNVRVQKYPNGKFTRSTIYALYTR
ncbi:hypothetical protein [Natrinema salinisoli]|uniref:hypothetical protein n=1 Tax=Natrinema salinisoli TaxID=2878535 RepID=UPI001CEFF8D5|nr:hypothetical protein [Natrinema salinisoli]